MVWWHKTKIWWKSKIVLYRYRQLHFACKSEVIYKNIAEDVEKRLDTSSFELDRPFNVGKNNKWIGLTKDKLGGQIMKKFIGLRPKMCSYLKDKSDESKKQKRQNSVP